jgi:hypothetical protein
VGSKRKSREKPDSLFSSPALRDHSPWSKDPPTGEEAVSVRVTDPPQGHSIEELGGDSSRLNTMIVLKVNEQSAMSSSGPPGVLHKGNGRQKEPGKVGLIGPISNRSSHGKRRREEVGSESNLLESHCRLEQQSFWERTLPLSLATPEGPKLSDSACTKGSGEARRKNWGAEALNDEAEMVDIAWNRSQENIDLATAEEDTHSKMGSEANEKGSPSWVHEATKVSGSDPALQRARRRNALRLLKANESDLNILSKYLPSDVAIFFPFEIEGPEDYYDVEMSWLAELIEVAKSKCDPPKAPHVRLGTAPTDLDHNTRYLESCDWDFEKVMAQHVNTTVGHGSEFRPVSELRRFLGRHPHFQTLSAMFTEGFDYHLIRELSEEERVAELSSQLVRGNHKSATDSEEEVQLLLEGDVRHGFVFPVWESALLKVKGCHLQPGGMVRQLSLKADGSRKIKNRFTHDLSFAINAEDLSINARVDMDQYPDMVYGWCFQRILHYLAALRASYPGVKIYLAKFDYSDAYKRISQSPRATAATVVRFGRIAYFCWRMVFGGSPNPAGFSCFSETLTDLANEIAMSRYHPKMGRSATVLPAHLVPKETEDPTDPIEESIGPALRVSTKMTSYRDCFIDDIIDCHLGTPANLERAPHIVQLAVQAMSRPHAGPDSEPVPRRPLLGPDKLEAEGRSAERQVVLGWEIRTRPFVVALPFDKYKAWREDLDKIIATGQATQQETESLIGRLNHASFLIPLSRHFLNEIRTKCLSVPRKKGQHIRFTDEEVKDLMLWQEFLDTAKGGLSINLLVVRTPTRIAWSDSCPFGLGGYTLKGKAWRIRVPSNCAFYGDDSVNNVLELLGMAISILLLLEEAVSANERFPCLLVLGDNTSAIAWLFKSGRIPRSSRYYPIVKAIARRIAMEVTAGQAQLCSQHIAGTMNVISDLLSFEGNCRQHTNPLTSDCPPNDILTHRILNYHSQIVPDGFRIQSLPPKVESFAFSIMRTIARSWSPKEKHPTKETIDTGDAGDPSLKIGDWETMLSSIRYQETGNSSCWQKDSLCHVECSTSTDRANLLQNVRNQWYRRLFEMPLAAWHRRSGNVDGQAPSTSRMESMVKDRSTPKSKPS